jgi:flagellar basal-body rod modification protein FlgD
MAIDPVSSATSAAQQSASAQAADQAILDYDSFLKLLVAEMKNQDPTEPMDSTEYVAQLATFSQVEQTIQTNSRLEDLLKSSSIAQAGSLIGRTVTSTDGTVNGIVQQVEIYDDGVVAILQDGQKIVVGPGLTVS